ncbi:3-oxoacyl-ACP synthase III family protein [Paraburkholderia megapolitana]|uniref:3-oxoacyl-ACP synthase III family protein n=1 Tax=Paraburkholderia megapolitana TaxID=420953 RepID=UPI0038BDDF07
MIVSIDRVRVSAITAALPSARLDMASLADEHGALEIRRIIESTGIRAVRVAGDLSTGDLCEAAARHLLAATDVRKESIDAVVVVTQTPDDFMPGAAVGLQARLGLSEECLAFDIDYGCSGYVYGLLQASMLVQAGCRSVLLCTGDVTTKLLKPGDRHVQMVFGDAASASLIEAGDGRIDFACRTDGSGAGHLRTPLDYANSSHGSAQVGHLHMSGNEVMNFALTRVPPLIDQLLAHCGIDKTALDLVALHQANQFMLRYLRKIMKLSEAQTPIGLSEVGNTGPSSIPLLLAGGHGLAGRARKESLLCGFGIGLSLAAARLDLSATRLIAPVNVAAPLVPDRLAAQVSV